MGRRSEVNMKYKEVHGIAEDGEKNKMNWPKLGELGRKPNKMMIK